VANVSRFVIRNDRRTPVVLNIEPEGAFFSLGQGQEVSVTDEFTAAPVTVKLTGEPGGDPVLSIWPGDGVVRVEKGGVDVLELM
jgi:hypothetical protein